MSNYDVLIIGGGTSGMMAAISAAKVGAKVGIIDKNKMLGKKLRLTGGGRCNVTNNCSPDEIIEYIPGNGRFLYSTFSQFNNYDIMSFFESNGVALKEEDHGRLFPVTNTSKTIVNCLSAKLKDFQVTLHMRTTVKSLVVDDASTISVITDDGLVYSATCVILSTGGKTFQYTGSSGDGYRFAEQLGHTVTPLFATESPIKSNDSFIRDKTLQGLSLRDAKLSVLNEEGKVITSHQMDLLFTHFGISGPAALRCSMFVNKELEKGRKKVTLTIDAFPNVSEQALLDTINKTAKTMGDKSIKNSLKQLLPERYLEFLLNRLNIDKSKPLRQLTDAEKVELTHLIKHFFISAYETYPLDKSFVTGGGVKLKEINPKTMESKLVSNLFFCGELLDINGYTGGYNITAAFATGFVAGKQAAMNAGF